MVDIGPKFITLYIPSLKAKPFLSPQTLLTLTCRECHKSDQRSLIKCVHCSNQVHPLCVGSYQHSQPYRCGCNKVDAASRVLSGETVDGDDGSDSPSLVYGRSAAVVDRLPDAEPLEKLYCITEAFFHGRLRVATSSRLVQGVLNARMSNPMGVGVSRCEATPLPRHVEMLPGMVEREKARGPGPASVPSRPTTQSVPRAIPRDPMSRPPPISVDGGESALPPATLRDEGVEATPPSPGLGRRVSPPSALSSGDGAMTRSMLGGRRPQTGGDASRFRPQTSALPTESFSGRHTGRQRGVVEGGSTVLDQTTLPCSPKASTINTTATPRQSVLGRTQSASSVSSRPRSSPGVRGAPVRRDRTQEADGEGGRERATVSALRLRQRRSAVLLSSPKLSLGDGMGLGGISDASNPVHAMKASLRSSMRTSMPAFTHGTPPSAMAPKNPPKGIASAESVMPRPIRTEPATGGMSMSRSSSGGLRAAPAPMSQPISSSRAPGMRPRPVPHVPRQSEVDGMLDRDRPLSQAQSAKGDGGTFSFSLGSAARPPLHTAPAASAASARMSRPGSRDPFSDPVSTQRGRRAPQAPASMDIPSATRAAQPQTAPRRLSTETLMFDRPPRNEAPAQSRAASAVGEERPRRRPSTANSVLSTLMGTSSYRATPNSDAPLSPPTPLRVATGSSTLRQPRAVSPPSVSGHRLSFSEAFDGRDRELVTSSTPPSAAPQTAMPAAHSHPARRLRPLSCTSASVPRPPAPRVVSSAHKRKNVIVSSFLGGSKACAPVAGEASHLVLVEAYTQLCRGERGLRPDATGAVPLSAFVSLPGMGVLGEAGVQDVIRSDRLARMELLERQEAMSRKQVYVRPRFGHCNPYVSVSVPPFPPVKGRADLPSLLGVLVRADQGLGAAASVGLCDMTCHLAQAGSLVLLGPSALTHLKETGEDTRECSHIVYVNIPRLLTSVDACLASLTMAGGSVFLYKGETVGLPLWIRVVETKGRKQVPRAEWVTEAEAAVPVQTETDTDPLPSHMSLTASLAQSRQGGDLPPAMRATSRGTGSRDIRDISRKATSMSPAEKAWFQTTSHLEVGAATRKPFSSSMSGM
ncbi:hypothetical protein KIPB_006095 [Kipferlia bialata]|uniref:Uncharacterized protein n=1 Tax=Kipferlia bialata TaxID=797122 RepID=A0A391NRT1_9EUKA|nr:hypothetical protein KIPB_006095 [Kipferlia bialata]|eukprot:g6095.t1